ncbi:hypothetical protein CL632_01950 [bacterium]|jgi:glucose-6-phosphate isomerase|nr:hypothetical protein [bacterium]MDP6571592.1 hypothetical protein [Patescibacteria group bacterium]MDP6756077.1 hypothetical protein [Patescibacteria group bacterium]|tara:strand:- start:2267 stop:3529 length:1263 start_codon:yes stop_codon:yes gene_type:complete
MKFKYKQTSNIKETDVQEVAKKLEPYLAELRTISQDSSYARDESALYLPHDEQLRKQVSKLANKSKSHKLKEVMVVGIGGSNLGTVAVYDALMPNGIALTFFDTIHVRTLKQANTRMRKIYNSKGEVLINFISKSGSTNETLVNARVLIDNLRDITDKWRDHIIVTTEPDSKLDDWAHNQGIPTLPNPVHVGGRYSVMSAVGIFPLALAGVDIKKLHKGAARMLERCLSNDVRKNYALQSAAAIYSAMKHKASIHNLFLFNMDLERVGKWHRQLFAESLGKDGKGITSIVSIGSNDLHSTFQMYLGGPKDKFTTFVRVKPSQDIHIASIDDELDAIVPELNQRSVTQVMDAIYDGTVASYQKRGLPFVEVILEKINEEELGAFLQFKMIETMLLGRLMNINAFDQPNVEEYKEITRELLG